MANDPTDIANLALDACGINIQLNDIEQGGREANVLLRAYPECLRQLLRAAPWAFARKQAALQLLADASGATPNVVGIYDSMLNLVATADYSPSIVRAIASDFGSTFYIAARDGTNATVIHTLDASGNAGATTWTMTDTSHFVYAMAPNRLNTILYFTSQSTSVTYAYDLTNSVDLPDLHAGFGGEIAHGSSDGFVDPGGNIWFGFATAASGANGKLRQFSSAGALLQTWTVVDATYTLLDHFTLDANETAVVVWTFNAGSTVALFETLDLVDQTVLESITATVTGPGTGYGRSACTST